MERRSLMNLAKFFLGFPGFLRRSSRQSMWSERSRLCQALLTRMQRLGSGC